MNDLKITYRDTILEIQDTIDIYFKYVSYIKRFILEPESITSMIVMDKDSDLASKFKDINIALKDDVERSKTIEIGMKYLKTEVKNTAFKIAELKGSLFNSINSDLEVLSENRALVNNILTESLNNNMGKILKNLATREYAIKKLDLILAPYLGDSMSANGYLNGILDKLSPLNIDLKVANNRYKNINSQLDINMKQIAIGGDDVEVVEATNYNDIATNEYTLLTDPNQLGDIYATDDTVLEILEKIVAGIISKVSTTGNIETLSSSIEAAKAITNPGDVLINDIIPKLVESFVNSTVTENEYDYLIDQYMNIVHRNVNNCSSYIDAYTHAEITVLEDINNTILINNTVVNILVNITVG